VSLIAYLSGVDGGVADLLILEVPDTPAQLATELGKVCVKKQNVDQKSPTFLLQTMHG
jgi:hypothetical protein